MPNKENLLKWVEALESGRYEQGQNYLRTIDDNKFCCLGVAEDLFNGDWSTSEAYPGKYVVMEGGRQEAICLTVPTQEVLGLGSFNPSMSIESVHGVRPSSAIFASRFPLAWLNDNGYTFAEIAQIIRLEYGLG